jgi:hypothetical protein
MRYEVHTQESMRDQHKVRKMRDTRVNRPVKGRGHRGWSR